MPRMRFLESRDAVLRGQQQPEGSEPLNAEAVKLAVKIKRNFEELGV